MKRHQNPWAYRERGIIDIIRWKLGLLPTAETPHSQATDDAAPWQAFQPTPEAPASWRATWLGHSSFLIQGQGLSLLIDPVFAEHCSPVPIRSLRRRVPTPCKLEELPKIDAVLLTHSHYDHMDLNTLRSLGTDTPLYVPSGHTRALARKGFTCVTEIAWHESATLAPGITLTATPAQHFTARTLWDRNVGHWCGWLIQSAAFKLWHAGDSGYCPAFAQLGESYGPIDFAMIPIGAYQPRMIMHTMHMNPEEAVQAFIDSRVERAVAMHWGTFRLTDEPMGEPPIRLREELTRRGIPHERFVAGTVGESWSITPSLR